MPTRKTTKTTKTTAAPAAEAPVLTAAEQAALDAAADSAGDEDGVEGDGEPDKPSKAKKPNFMASVDPATLDGEGKLTSIPTTFDPSTHRAPKRTNFADEADFYDFSATLLEDRMKRTVDKIAAMREQAVALRKHGDPAVRKKVAKLARMKAAMAALEKSLEDAGDE